MSGIEPPDSFFVSSASGWLDFGLFEEGLKELDAVRPKFQNHPDVAALRWTLNSRLGRWKECAVVAERLIEVHPGNIEGWVQYAYATRRAPDGGLHEARRILLTALDRFPAEPIIPYNLSCYDCQLGLNEEALVWLALTLKRAGGKKDRRHWLEMALKDDDLEAVREAVQRLIAL
jgi:tetratricopeptide (TPR) repeat protein